MHEAVGIQCQKCGGQMVGCHRASENMKLKRWYCPSCGHHEAPVGREWGLVPRWHGPPMERDQEVGDA